MNPPYAAVSEPHKSIKLLTSTVVTPNHKDVPVHRGCSRVSKNIPADTKVAECISAEAGAGASIESGSHVWKKN